MSLLTPLYLLGLAAVALPIVFHMIRQRPRGRRVFSTVMFLEPSPPRVTRRSRLDHWPLLLLRAAALCLLALAFARPLVRELLGTDATQAPGENVVVLVDTSASMRRERLWEEALRRAEEIIARCQPADRVAILAYDRLVQPVMTFEEWTAVDSAARQQLAAERLRGITPGWAATHLDQALAAAVELLNAPRSLAEPAHGEGAKRIVVVSDLARGSRLQALGVHEWPDDVTVRIERVSPDSPTNAGLQIVAVDDSGSRQSRRTELHSVRQASGESNASRVATTPLDAIEADESSSPARGPSGTPSYGAEEPARHVRARVTNAADSVLERFSLGWQDSGGGTSRDVDPVEVYCPPGQSRVVRVAVPAECSLPARLVLHGDDHDFDNTATVDQPGSEEVHVLVYSDEPTGDSAGLRFYLERAFATPASGPVTVTVQPRDAPGPVPIPRDVPLVIATTNPGEDRIPALRRHVEQGGTLLIVAATSELCGLWEQILGSNGLHAEEADVAGYAMLSGIDFGHPLFAPFNEPRFADFTNVRIWQHRQLAFNGSASGESRILARFDSGSPAMLEQPLGRGRVLLFAFGWHPADSQLALSTKFVPLLHALVGLAIGADESPQRLAIGDPLPLADRVMETEADLTVHTPDQRTVQLTAGAAPFDDTIVPGVYRVAAGRGPERRFTVSLPPEESRTAPLELEQLEAAGVRLAATESQETAVHRAARERQLRTAELEQQQKHWRWLIVGALAVLIVETGLAGRCARQQPALRQASSGTTESRSYGEEAG